MNVFVRFAVSCLLLFSTGRASAGVELIEISEVQLVRELSGVVEDSSGALMKGVLVEEFSSDWKKVLRSSHTDAEGTFLLRGTKDWQLHWLQVSCNGFNPMRFRMRVDPNRGKPLRLTMHVST
jgi:carboxypeptidase family protein